METFRLRTVFLRWDPNDVTHCRILPTDKLDYTVACLNYTLQTMMTLPGWPVMAPNACDINNSVYVCIALYCWFWPLKWYDVYILRLYSQGAEQRQQDAQLSHRDCAAGCVWTKVEDWNWETIFYGHYRSIFNHCNIIGQQSNRIRWKNAK